MKIIAFGASSSKQSINQQLAYYTAKQFKNADLDLLDLNDFPLSVFSVDEESENGIPQNAINFVNRIKNSDIIIISMAEHNGTYTAAFKNIFDWATRAELKFFEGKKMILLSTSPGPRGGLGSMEAAKTRFPIHGANIVASFSLPKFADNFNAEKGITDLELKKIFENTILNII